MFTAVGRLGRSPRLLAVLCACLLPAVASAEAITVRNEAGAPVVVQAACVIRGRVVRDRPRLLNPGDTSPPIVLPGDKIVTAYDGRVPTRVLFQGVVPAGLTDQAYRLVADPKGPGVKLEPVKPPGGGDRGR